MFGFGKKHLLAKMNGLINVAQTVVGTMLGNHFNFNAAQSDSERDTLAARAAAWSNYLFLRPLNSQHVHMNLKAEYQAARNWLTKNDLARELVVQSIRVALTVAYAKTGTVMECDMGLLNAFGAEFPNAPDPESYEALVNRAFALLPSEQQQSIKSYFH